MKIHGLLEEKLKKGNVVLFLGAGVGQAVGLKGTQDLSLYLFEKSILFIISGSHAVAV